MKEVRYFYVPNARNMRELPEEEVGHAIRVLRLKQGDEIVLMDGCGTYYKAEIDNVLRNHCFYRILDEMPQEPQWEGYLHLGIAPTKMMERIEWMAEKITEIGINEVSFLECKNSERKIIKLPRVDRILISAVKQSHKAWKPILNGIINLEEFLASDKSEYKYIAHCHDEIPRTYLFDELRSIPHLGHVTILIGPEGDFTVEEVKAAQALGYVSVHLGSSRLRTETAGMVATMMMHLSCAGM